jgi:hypothetical protein
MHVLVVGFRNYSYLMHASLEIRHTAQFGIRRTTLKATLAKEFCSMPEMDELAVGLVATVLLAFFPSSISINSII